MLHNAPNVDNSTEARVRYAGELDSSMKKQLEAVIQEKFPESTGVSFTQDDSIIAGIVIEYRDYLYEDTVVRGLREFE